MSRYLLPLLALSALASACSPDADRAAAPLNARTTQQAVVPVQDTGLWAAPAGNPSNGGGPTNNCEVEILRERTFTTTPPDTTGTGITLTPADPLRDGKFSQSIYVRNGPFLNVTADPDCAGVIVIPAGLTVVGVSGVSDAQDAAANLVFGIPGLNYSTTSPGMEAGEGPFVTVNMDGTTTVSWAASINQTPYSDTFRILLDHGDAFQETSFAVAITAGDSINVGGTNGNGQKSALVSLGSAECGDGVVGSGETCDDGDLVAGDGCDATCQIEPGFTCPSEGGQCLTVDLVAPADGAALASASVTVSGTATAGAQVTVELLSGGAPVATQLVTATGGVWSVSLNASPDGAYTAQATVTTTGGDLSDSNDFTVDTAAPAAPVVIVPANGATTNNTPSISGTAEASSTVTVIVDGAPVGTTTASGVGAWSFTSAVLADGAHTARATATDAVGNTGVVSNTNTFTVDSVPPAAPVVLAPANGATTNDNTPSISGTAEANSSVALVVDGLPYGTAAADGAGAWSFTGAALADGAHTVRATATDAAANTSVASNTNTFTIDTAAPAAPVVLAPANGATTNDNTPTISGTAEANSTVTVIVDGTAVGTTTASGAGAWSFTSAALTDGAHTARATATDAASNTGAASNTNTFTVDTAAPAAPVVVAPANGATTNDNTPSISGTAEANSTVTVIVDGTAVGTATASGVGAWSFTSAALADGAHTVRATAADAVGNTSVVSNTNTFTVDATPPAAPVVLAPANGSRSNDDTPTISGTAEANSTVTVIVDGTAVGTATASGAGAWSFTSAVLADGAHTARATATDAAGNASAASNTNTFTVDTAAPAAPVVLAPADGALTNDNTPSISGTAEANSTVNVRVDGAAVGTATASGAGAWSFTSAALADGAHTVSATATDAAGNTGAASNTNTFTVDTAAPVVTITAPAAAAVLDNNAPTILGAVDDPAAVTTIRVDGGAAQPVVLDGTGAYSVALTGLAEGAHTVIVAATDAAGNSAQVSRTFSVDTTLPTPTITAPGAGDVLSDNTPTISGTGEPGSTILVEVLGTMGTASSTQTTVNAQGDWSSDATTLADGNYNVIITATDAAGNSAGAGPRPFSIDATAPPVAITQPANGATTADTTPTVSGTSDPAVAIFVELLDATQTVVASSTVASGPQGGWSMTPAAALPAGVYTARATATDGAGNTSAPVTVTFTIDTSAPALTITSPAGGSAIADTTPALAGSADPGAQIALVVRDAQGMSVAQLMATADNTGAWSVDSSALTEGAYTLEASTTNAAGTATSDQVSFTLDLSVALAVATPAPGAQIADDTPGITGTAEVGATITITLLDSAGATVFTTTTTASAQGVWSATSTTLPDGDYTAQISAEDALGNMASAPDIAFTIDTTAPAIAITQPLDGALLGVAPSLEGTSEPGASILVVVEDSAGALILSETVVADNNGVWSVPGTALVDAGVYTITAVAQDEAGNSAQATSSFTLDLTMASVAILQPTSGAVLTTELPTISGTASPDAGVVLTITDSLGMIVGVEMLTPDANGDWSITVSAALAEGDYVVTAEANRVNGTSATAMASFTIDLVDPAVVVITAPADGLLTNNATVAVSGTAEPGATVALTLDGQDAGSAEADVNGAWTLDVALGADGMHTITASTPGSTASVTVTLDTAAPVVAITSPAEGGEVAGDPLVVSGTGEPGSTIIITVDGVEVERVTVLPDGTWTWTAPGATGAGAHTVSVVAQDAADNSSAPISVAFTVISPATVTITSPVADQTTGPSPVITGAATAGESVSVSIDGEVVGAAIAGDDGAWSLSLEALEIVLAAGPHTVSASVADGAATAGPVAFVVEVSEPADPNAGVTLSGDGCACATAPARPDAPHLAWLGLLALVGLIRRRRHA